MSIQHKTALITGATSGIGKQTALALALGGATTLLVGRDANKGAQTQKDIQSQSRNEDIHFLCADLSSQDQVRQLANEVKNRFPKLDILVNNAGAVFFERRLSKDSIEMTFAVNHLAPFLLTSLLLDTLKAGAPSRIINVSSKQHTHAHLDEDDWQMAKKYNGMEAYHRSKLANLLFWHEKARIKSEASGTKIQRPQLSSDKERTSSESYQLWFDAPWKSGAALMA